MEDMMQNAQSMANAMISTMTVMETNERAFTTLKTSAYIQEISIPKQFYCLLSRPLHFCSFTRID